MSVRGAVIDGFLLKYMKYYEYEKYQKYAIFRFSYIAACMSDYSK